MAKVFSFEGLFKDGIIAQNKLIIPVLAADPSGGALVEGLVWFNSTDNVLRYYDGTAVITPGSGSLSAEDVRDIIGSALVAGNNIDITVNDALDTITIDVEALSSADISDFDSASDSRISAVVTAAFINALTGVDADTLGGSTKAQVISEAIAGVVDSAPATLDTLNELAAALGDDANFATTVTNALAAKARTYVETLDGGALTEVVTHNLNTRDLHAQVYVASGNYETEEYIIQRTSVNTVTVVSEGNNIPTGRRIVLVAVGA